jgi:hypothetical protein
LINRSKVKTASISCIVLLILTASVAAQQVPRKKKNPTCADREAWHKILRWPDEYEGNWCPQGDATGDGLLEFYNLGRGKYLVEVDAYPVAYQAGFIYVLYDERNKPNGPGQLLLLKGFERKDRSGHPLSYSEVSAAFTKFHAKTKVLEIYSKYRAQGDCGLFVRYRFVGSRPTVIEARERDCDESRRGPIDIDPRRWPRKKL